MEKISEKFDIQLYQFALQEQVYFQTIVFQLFNFDERNLKGVASWILLSYRNGSESGSIGFLKMWECCKNTKL